MSQSRAASAGRRVAVWSTVWWAGAGGLAPSSQSPRDLGRVPPVHALALDVTARAWLRYDLPAGTLGPPQTLAYAVAVRNSGPDSARVALDGCRGQVLLFRTPARTGAPVGAGDGRARPAEQPSAVGPIPDACAPQDVRATVWLVPDATGPR